MKALTIKQPHASAILAGLKAYETRSWTTRHRGPLAIHAGVSVDASARERARDDGLAEELPTGVVLGVVELLDCIAAEEVRRARDRRWGDFSPGRFAWHLRVIEAFAKPVPARGMLGLWEWRR